MKSIVRLLAAGFLFVLGFSAQAQVVTSFSTTTPNPAIGATFAVDFKVTGFMNVQSVECPISFDPTVLEAVSITASTLPGFKISAVDSNLTDVVYGKPNHFGPAGRIYTAWLVNLGQFANGYSYPGGAGRIFTINFKALKNCTTVLKVAKVKTSDKIEFATPQGPATVSSQNLTIVAGTGDCPTPPPTYTGTKVIANNIYIPKGEIGCMPVTVNGHKDIEAFQYSIQWTDKPLITFEGPRPVGNMLPGFDPGYFIAKNSLGYLNAGWASAAGKLTFPNVIAPIYEVCFRAQGAAGTNTPIKASHIGFPPDGPSPASIDSINGTPIPKNLWKSATVPVEDTVYIVSAIPPPGAVTFTADKDTVAPNLTTCVDIKAKNFKGIEYAEFALKYDTLKLQYQSINLGTNPLGLVATQNETDPTTNKMPAKGVRHVTVEQNFGFGDFVKYVQFQYRGTGITLPEDATMFSVCFKATGQVGDNAKVEVGSVLISTAGVLVPIGAWKAIPISGVPVAAVAGNVNIKSALAATLAATNPTCNAGTNGSIATTTAANGCTGNLSYLWTGPGITPTNRTLANPTGLTAGVYTVTVTCSVGPVTTTASVTLTQPTAVAFAANPAVVGVTCPNDANGTITISVTGGATPYTYNWSGPAPFTSVNAPNLTALKTGDYKVTVTDASNCAFTNSNTAIKVGTPAGISALATPTHVKCFDGNNGAISLNISGGTPSYTVQWSGPNGYTGTGPTISNLKGGIYTPTVTDSKMCTQVGQPANVQTPSNAMNVPTASAGDVICFGTKTGKATCNPVNGTAPYSYIWRDQAGAPASTAKDPINLGCGTFTVVVTDNSGCTATGTMVTINCPTAALTVKPTPTAATCGTNGKICLEITGGWNNPTATVAWDKPNVTGNCPSGVGSGDYAVTVTDEKGCSVTATTTVAGPPQFTMSETVTNVSCFGAGNGAITVVPGGGAGGPYEVTWSGTANLNGTTIASLQPGTYTPVVKDKEGCTQTFPSYNVTSPDVIAVTDTNVVHQVGTGNNGSIEVTAVTGGTLPFTYAWTGPNGFTAVTEDIQNLAPGVYNLSIKDDKNCTFTAAYEVKADFAAVATLKKGACGVSADGCITVTIAGTTPGPYKVTWDGNTNPKEILSSPANICGFAGGSAYTLIVTNAAGQVFTMQPVTVPVLDAPVYGHEDKNPNEDLKNGHIKIKPTPINSPLQYAWSNGEIGPNLVQLDSGIYTVTITHFVTGCTAVKTFHLEREYPPAAFKWLEVTNPKCKSAKDGVLKIQFSGADSPYGYKWAGPSGVIAGATTTTLGGLGAGAYTVTVTDERGLEFVYDTVLTSQSLLTISTVDELSNINGFQVSGATVCDGVALVSYTGQVNGATIAWSNGGTSATNSTLCGGAYSVTVTDGLGCSSVWTDALTAPEGIALTGKPTQAVTCAGACDGKARVTVSGGVAPYAVVWSNGQTDNIVNTAGFSESIELCGGEYSVTVTDKNLVSTVTLITLPEPAPVALTFASQEPSAFSTCDGEVIATATGTTGLTTWTWSVVNRPGKNGTDQRAKGLCAGEVVQFSVVDANGCSAVGRDSVPFPPDGCLKVGTVITANGDNLNDYFGITCIQGLKNTLEIYNRWGQLVYTAENYDSSPNGFIGTKYWDGTSNGQELPEGAYFFVLNYTDEDGNAQQLKGHVTLLR